MASSPKIQIDRGIPLPANARGSQAIYPFQQMRVGDSFLHPGNKTAAAAAAFYFNRRNRSEFKFSYQEQDGGTRVWRRA